MTWRGMTERPISISDDLIAVLDEDASCCICRRFRVYDQVVAFGPFWSTGGHKGTECSECIFILDRFKGSDAEAVAGDKYHAIP